VYLSVFFFCQIETTVIVQAHQTGNILQEDICRLPVKIMAEECASYMSLLKEIDVK